MPPVRLIITIDGEDHEINVPEEVVRAWIEIAQRNGQSFETALRQALVNENRIEDALEPGGKLLLEKQGKLQELSYEPA